MSFIRERKCEYEDNNKIICTSIKFPCIYSFSCIMNLMRLQFCIFCTEEFIMKRKLLTILLAASMILPLSACGSSSGTTSSDSNETTESTETSSDDSKDNKSSKAPSKVTADNILDFPVTDDSKFDWSNGTQQTYDTYDTSTECACYNLNVNSIDKSDIVIRVPSEHDGKKVTQIGGGSNGWTLLGVGGSVNDPPFDQIKGIIIPSSVTSLDVRYYNGISVLVPKNLKYVVLPKSFEGDKVWTDEGDDTSNITFIYEDVE